MTERKTLNSFPALVSCGHEILSKRGKKGYIPLRLVSHLLTLLENLYASADTTQKKQCEEFVRDNEVQDLSNQFLINSLSEEVRDDLVAVERELSPKTLSAAYSLALRLNNEGVINPGITAEDDGHLNFQWTGPSWVLVATLIINPNFDEAQESRIEVVVAGTLKWSMKDTFQYPEELDTFINQLKEHSIFWSSTFQQPGRPSSNLDEVTSAFKNISLSEDQETPPYIWIPSMTHKQQEQKRKDDKVASSEEVGFRGFVELKYISKNTDVFSLDEQLRNFLNKDVGTVTILFCKFTKSNSYSNAINIIVSKYLKENDFLGLTGKNTSTLWISKKTNVDKVKIEKEISTIVLEEKGGCTIMWFDASNVSSSVLS
jgi:hypothetical protein